MWDLLAEYRPFAVHLGALCATVLPGGLRSSGQALRSKTQPLGLPTLDEASSSRVRAANAVYRFCYELLRHCLRHDINVSLDNPANSFLWHIFEHFAQSDGLRWPLAGLVVVMFDNCCHGGPRPTQRRVVASTGLLNRLSTACPRNHYHEPWGSPPATPTADAYPPLLAKRWSDCFATRAEAQGLSLSSASEFHAISLAATARQSRKFQPLLPEFREIAYMPVSFCPDKSCKILLSHDSTGDAEGANRLLPVTQNRSRSRVRGGEGSTMMSDAATVGASSRTPPRPACLSPGGSGELLKVGFWFTPQEHLAKAKKLSHPMDYANPVAPQACEVLNKYMTSSSVELSMARRLALLKVRLLVRTLDKDEAQLHEQFPAWYEKVVASKKILAWKKLLEENDYDDLDVTKFLLKGCPLVGTSDLPEAFDSKLVPANRSCGRQVRPAGRP